MLIAAPVPSTGVVATSPSVAVAMAPVLNELAGATAAAVPVALALALGVAVALAEADPEAVGVADALAVGW
jgi:hypothetical protein